jgi:hypothetical protein
MSQQSSTTPPSPGRSSLRRPFWIAFFLVLVVLALLTAYAAIRGVAQLTQQQLPERGLVRLIIDGRPHDLPGEGFAQLFPELAAALDQEQGRAEAEIGAKIDRRLDAAFAPAIERIPHFADWYYSLPGEYSRYAAALGITGSGDLGAFMVAQFQETVTRPANLEELVDELPGLLDPAVAELVREGLGAVAARLEALALAQGIPPTPEYTIRIDETFDLGAVIQARLQIGSEDVARQAGAAALGVGVGTAMAKGLGAVVVKKSVAKVAGTKSFQLAAALLAKFAVKAAAKGGGAGAAAAAGAVLCSPTGPGALLCGAIAGVVTWLLVDEAFIAFDEALNRGQFEAEIRQALVDQREELRGQLRDVYKKTLAGQFGAVGAEFEAMRAKVIERTFVPSKIPPKAEF